MEQLFGSKTRVKLLKLFMSNPNRSFYVREITRKVEEQINSVRRELANLLSLGIISSDSTNNKLYYEVSQDNEHYAALRLLFTGKQPAAAQKSAKKTTRTKEAAEGDAEEAKAPATTPPVVANAVDEAIWAKAGNITGLVYSGVFTRDMSSPVDVLIIGDVPVARAEAAVSKLEKQEGKELRYAIIEHDEWRYRKQVNDKFWLQIAQAKKQIVKDTDGLFA